MTKLNLQGENYNLGRFQNINLEKKTEFSDCVDKYGHKQL